MSVTGTVDPSTPSTLSIPSKLVRFIPRWSHPVVSGCFPHPQPPSHNTSLPPSLISFYGSFAARFSIPIPR